MRTKGKKFYRVLICNLVMFFLYSCSYRARMPEQSPVSVVLPQSQYNQQQYYYPRPQNIQNSYSPMQVPNFRYYTNPYNHYSNPQTRTYQDYDQYYLPPTYYENNDYHPYKEDEEKARERSAGVANQMYNN